MKWTKGKIKSSLLLEYKGWAIKIMEHHNERYSKWLVLSPSGERMGEWRSGYSTGLRRVAHIIAKGSYHQLTIETYNVPADVDKLWHTLESSFLSTFKHNQLCY